MEVVVAALPVLMLHRISLLAGSVTGELLTGSLTDVVLVVLPAMSVVHMSE